jgi:hypothetical protein
VPEPDAPALLIVTLPAAPVSLAPLAPALEAD